MKCFMLISLALTLNSCRTSSNTSDAETKTANASDYSGLIIDCRAGAHDHFVARFKNTEPAGPAFVTNATSDDSILISGSTLSFSQSGSRSHANVAWIGGGITIELSPSGDAKAVNIDDAPYYQSCTTSRSSSTQPQTSSGYHFKCTLGATVINVNFKTPGSYVGAALVDAKDIGLNVNVSAKELTFRATSNQFVSTATDGDLKIELYHQKRFVNPRFVLWKGRTNKDIGEDQGATCSL